MYYNILYQAYVKIHRLQSYIVFCCFAGISSDSTVLVYVQLDFKKLGVTCNIWHLLQSPLVSLNWCPFFRKILNFVFFPSVYWRSDCNGETERERRGNRCELSVCMEVKSKISEKAVFLKCLIIALLEVQNVCFLKNKKNKSENMLPAACFVCLGRWQFTHCAASPLWNEQNKVDRSYSSAVSSRGSC